MHVSVRRATLTVADAVTEGLDMGTVVIGGVIGAWAGYTYSPDTWSGDWRLAFAGGTAVVTAVAVNGMADLILAPVRRWLYKARDTARPATLRTALAAPGTLDEGLAQVTAATEDDAAARAASAAWHIDQSNNFLRGKNRWRGYEDATASFYLAPGVWLHYRTETNKYGHDESHFTLLTSDGDRPMPITGMEQVRHHLAARAASLPLAPATGTEDRDQDDVPDIDPDTPRPIA